MEYRIKGDFSPFLEVKIQPGEEIVAETGKMSYMSDNVEMQTSASGGLMSSVKRSISGESFFVTTFSTQQGEGIINFAAEFPGDVIALDLDQGREVLAQEDAFLCSESGNLDTEFTTSLASGLLGGEGFKMTKVQGPGMAFLNAGGEVDEIQLQQGQKIKVDTGSVVAFDKGMKYNVERVKGVKNALFGGEGLFLTTLEGPGTVWIQSLPVQELALKVSQYIPTQG
ncbi:TIGR00266 family protein [Candidatus Nanohalovita haloferacivicina]|uniref:TIGR00266 family protein n=1 Tax=Candidatus Nanohalovita haloferacivicina TaxID=2978046 RepID=UPI00325F9FFF|nr:AIM24 family protein [Candidatus Nanohalobia archaeon BNXNv]